MRELVLNHASLMVDSRSAAVEALKDIISGMVALVRCGAAGPVLRSARDMTQMPCAPDFSFFDALLRLQGTGAREELAFFAGLATKSPLVSDLGAEHRIFITEAQDMRPDDGAPLLLCALDDSVAVSFPTSPGWDRDRIVVEFRELLPDGTFSDESEEIDHLSRAGHAEPICLRYQESRRANLRSGEELWRRRREAFPNLLFGLDVEDDVAALPHLRTAINRLSELDAAAADWSDGPAPPWTCKVTNESARVQNNPQLREARRFRSRSGAHEFFFWHARFGNHGRIHLRFDAAAHEVEIGYIGRHLPL